MQKTAQGWVKNSPIITNSKENLQVQFQNTSSTDSNKNGFSGGFADRVKLMNIQKQEEELLLDDKD